MRQRGYIEFVQQITGLQVEKRRLDFRIEESEFAILELHCERVGRTKTDVLRELIRNLRPRKERQNLKEVNCHD